jgi:hypothetical protein
MEANKANREMLEAGFDLDNGMRKNITLEKENKLLESAKELYQNGEYIKAYQLANQAKDKTKVILHKAEEASSLLEEAKFSISTNLEKGFIQGQIKSDLNDWVLKADSFYQKGMFSEARNVAGEALKLSSDVDRDGIYNEDDFAPFINNNYIYVTIVFLSLILLGYIYYVYRKEAVQRKVESLDLESTVRLYFHNRKKNK